MVAGFEMTVGFLLVTVFEFDFEETRSVVVEAPVQRHSELDLAEALGLEAAATALYRVVELSHWGQKLPWREPAVVAMALFFYLSPQI